MSQPVVIAVLTVVGTIAGALVTVHGAKLALRWAAKAQVKTVEAQAYTRASDALFKTIDALQADVAGVRTAQAEDRRVHRKEMSDLRARVGVMEVQRTALTAYIRRLLSLIREDGRLVPPPLPPGMTIDED